jgi:hypothetical protein
MEEAGNRRRRRIKVKLKNKPRMGAKRGKIKREQRDEGRWERRGARKG